MKELCLPLQKTCSYWSEPHTEHYELCSYIVSFLWQAPDEKSRYWVKKLINDSSGSCWKVRALIIYSTRSPSRLSDNDLAGTPCRSICLHVRQRVFIFCMVFKLQRYNAHSNVDITCTPCANSVLSLNLMCTLMYNWYLCYVSIWLGANRKHLE